MLRYLQRNTKGKIIRIRTDISVHALRQLIPKTNDEHNGIINPTPKTRVYATSDIHGDSHLFTKILTKLTNLVTIVVDDDGKKWYQYNIQEKPFYFLIIGDIFDTIRDQNNPPNININNEKEILKIFNCLRVMSEQYDEGRFILCLGNHEVMNVMGDFRYADGDPKIRRGEFWNPEGELIQLLNMANPYGMVLIGKTIFVHGGISPTFLKKMSKVNLIENINKTARQLVSLNKMRTTMDVELEKLYKLIESNGHTSSQLTTLRKVMPKSLHKYLQHFMHRLNESDADLVEEYGALYRFVQKIQNPMEYNMFSSPFSIVWDRNLSSSTSIDPCGKARNALEMLKEYGVHADTFVMGHSPQYMRPRKDQMFRKVAEKTDNYIKYVIGDGRKTNDPVIMGLCKPLMIYAVDIGAAEGFKHLHNNTVKPQILSIEYDEDLQKHVSIRVALTI